MRSIDAFDAPEWPQLLSDLATRHQVPGAQAGVLLLDEQGNEIGRRVFATGVTSLRTGVEVTRDTLFQCGSITKVWTATLIMQLVEDGALDLDSLVRDLLPEFTLADPEAAAAITVRQLLNHSSGIDGDIFLDTGDGDDCVERYVAGLASARSVTPPGGPASYCNAGFVVAGRIVEVLRGAVWDDVLVDRLLRPLELDQALTRAKEAPLFRVAVGHSRPPGADHVEPTTTWMLPRSIGPAGLLTASVDTLLGFAATHLRGGVGLTGTRVLGRTSTLAMQEEQAGLGGRSTVQEGWGVAWSRERWAGHRVIGHDGGTIGQRASLRLFPDLGLVLAVLTNGTDGPGLIHDWYDAVGPQLGVTQPVPRLEPAATTADLEPALGAYESAAERWELRRGADGGVDLLIVSHLEELSPTRTVPVRPLGPGRFAVELDGREAEVTYVEADGRSYLYNSRLLPRLTDPTIGSSSTSSTRIIDEPGRGVAGAAR
jgi:CubicO group peptidase (beta-lactamase class C family)